MAHDATFMYGITDLVGYQGGGQVGGKKKRLYPLITFPGTVTHKRKRLHRIAKKQNKSAGCSVNRQDCLATRSRSINTRLKKQVKRQRKRQRK